MSMKVGEARHGVVERMINNINMRKERCGTVNGRSGCLNEAEAKEEVVKKRIESVNEGRG